MACLPVACLLFFSQPPFLSSSPCLIVYLSPSRSPQLFCFLSLPYTCLPPSPLTSLPESSLPPSFLLSISRNFPLFFPHPLPTSPLSSFFTGLSNTFSFSLPASLPPPPSLFCRLSPFFPLSLELYAALCTCMSRFSRDICFFLGNPSH